MYMAFPRMYMCHFCLLPLQPEVKLEQPDDRVAAGAPSGVATVEDKKQLFAAAVAQAGQQQGFPLQQPAQAPLVPGDVAAECAAEQLEKEKIEARIARRQRRAEVKEEREAMLLRLQQQQEALEQQRLQLQARMEEEDAKVQRGHERKRRRKLAEAGGNMESGPARPSSSVTEAAQALSEQAAQEQWQRHMEQNQLHQLGKPDPAAAPGATEGGKPFHQHRKKICKSRIQNCKQLDKTHRGRICRMHQLRNQRPSTSQPEHLASSSSPSKGS